MRYILNPRFDISLRNIEPSHKILNPGFNISWPLYIEHPFDFHLLLERGGSKYHGHDISTPPSFTNSNWRRGSKYYVLIYRTPPSDYHCYCRRGSKYYGCNHWTPLYFQLERGFKISWSWYNDTLLRDTRS